MHQPVLERYVNQLLRSPVEGVVNDSPDPPVVSQNFLDGGPI
jgi:hypothetical protein